MGTRCSRLAPRLNIFSIFGHHRPLVEAGSCAMLCLVCGAEMRLVEVVQDTTMLVPGYEHHTWQCSGCSTVEQRLTFSREKTPTAKVPVKPTQPEPPAVEQQ